MRIETGWNNLWGTADEMQELWDAISAGDYATVKKSLAHRPKLLRRERTTTAFEAYAASPESNYRVLDLLLRYQAGCDPRQVGDPVRVACENGN